jgi:hypothetical protein
MPAPKGHANYDVDHLAGRPEIYTEDVLNKMADDLMKWLETPTNVLFKDFCLDQKINPRKMLKWAEDNERFRAAYEFAKERQQSRLLNGGLNDIYNGTVMKFIMTNVHGWSDKQEMKVSGDAENPMLFALTNSSNNSTELVNEGH